MVAVFLVLVLIAIFIVVFFPAGNGMELAFKLIVHLKERIESGIGRYKRDRCHISG